MITFNFHRGNKPISRMIRLFSGGQYNHVSIKIGRTIYEAHIKNGVTKTSQGLWNDETVAVSAPFEFPYEKEAKKFLEKQVGKKYDILGIFAFLWVFAKPKKGKWYCSELAQVALYKALGIKSTDSNYQQKVSPQDFYYNLLDLTQILSK